MTLYRYFGKRFLLSFFRVLAIIALLMFIIEALEQVRFLSNKGGTLQDALTMASLRAPSYLNTALPIVAMIGSLTMCADLARSNEFIVSRASGMSAMKTILFPMGYAFIFGAIMVLTLNPFIATLQVEFDRKRASFIQPSAEYMSLVDGGIWLRQKTENGLTIISADRSNKTGTRLSQVTLVESDDSGVAKRRIEARSAQLYNQEWILNLAKVWDLSKGVENPEAIAQEKPILRVATTVTSEQILDGIPTPETKPLWELPAFIKQIESSGFSSVRERMHFQAELARPFLFSAMVIVGAVFMFQTARLGHTGISVLLALICGFLLHFLQNFAKTLGTAAEIPVPIAAWVPPLAAILFALGVFLHLEDG